MKPKIYIKLVVNYKATRTPPKFQIKNKGAFIYYVINIGGRGGNPNAYVCLYGVRGVLMKRLLIMLIYVVSFLELQSPDFAWKLILTGPDFAWKFVWTI